jgi:hypothetical protein
VFSIFFQNKRLKNKNAGHISIVIQLIYLYYIYIYMRGDSCTTIIHNNYTTLLTSGGRNPCGRSHSHSFYCMWIELCNCCICLLCNKHFHIYIYIKVNNICTHFFVHAFIFTYLVWHSSHIQCCTCWASLIFVINEKAFLDSKKRHQM